MSHTMTKFIQLLLCAEERTIASFLTVRMKASVLGLKQMKIKTISFKSLCGQVDLFFQSHESCSPN